MVSEKVSDSVSEEFGIEKSFGFGFVQILGNVTHCVPPGGAHHFHVNPFSKNSTIHMIDWCASLGGAVPHAGARGVEEWLGDEEGRRRQIKFFNSSIWQ